MKKVFIATSREVGEQCVLWARNNTPNGFVLVDNIQHADIVLSVMYEKIIPADIVKSKKCYNFHPGVLPEYKGSGIFTWVLLNQESKFGITLHLIDQGVDTGDIIEIREFLISKDDTAFSLYQKNAKTMLKMFKDWYADLLFEDYIATPQRKNVGKYYLKKDLQKAKNLTRFVKAFYFPGKGPLYYFNNKGKKIYINYKEEE